jgi:hypothetical protein
MTDHLRHAPDDLVWVVMVGTKSGESCNAAHTGTMPARNLACQRPADQNQGFGQIAMSLRIALASPDFRRKNFVNVS